jgi:cytochrome P450
LEALGYTWLPFGGGAHCCLGAALAELEIKVALATMLNGPTIAPADAHLAPPACRGLTLVPHSGGRIRVLRDAGPNRHHASTESPARTAPS